MGVWPRCSGDEKKRWKRLGEQWSFLWGWWKDEGGGMGFQFRRGSPAAMAAMGVEEEP